MDMEGVGAIAAAAVAAATVPITVLIGRWQVRAAIRAGEATYRAAVDAAHQQGTAAHSQWRREVRRQAYTSFLTAIHEVETHTVPVFKSHAYETLYSAEAWASALSTAQESLYRAAVIIDLKGPSEAAYAARDLRLALLDQADIADGRVKYGYAMSYLFDKERQERTEATASTGAERVRGPALRAL